MLLFVGMSLLEGIATGPVYIKKYSQQKNEVEISSLEGIKLEGETFVEKGLAKN